MRFVKAKLKITCDKIVCMEKRKKKPDPFNNPIAIQQRATRRELRLLSKIIPPLFAVAFAALFFIYNSPPNLQEVISNGTDPLLLISKCLPLLPAGALGLASGKALMRR